MVLEEVQENILSRHLESRVGWVTASGNFLSSGYSIFLLCMVPSRYPLYANLTKFKVKLYSCN